MSTLLSLLLFLTSCTASRAGGVQSVDQLKTVQAAGVLRAAVKVDAAPFAFTLGGVNAGFEIDLLGAIAREMGIENIEYVAVSSSQRINTLLKDKVDIVIANMTVTRGREALIDFSLPYFQDGQMLLVHKDSQISNYLDLSGKKVGCIKDTTGEKAIRVVAPNAVVKVFADNTAMT